MGLDLTVSVVKSNGQDERGNFQYIHTTVGNLRNCWNILEELNIENCTTKGVELEELEQLLDSDISENEVETLQDVIKEIKQYDNVEYIDVHCWY